jgi:tetratricopeptide (TPR) repeat protein
MIPPANEEPPAEAQDVGTVDIMKKKRRLFDRGAETRAELAAAYRDVLLVLGASGRDAALSALFEFESGYMEGRHPKEVEQLLEAEVEVVRWLGTRDLEAVVPLLSLHHDAYRLYTERGVPILAGHSSRLAASVADLYAREGNSEGSRVLGARALATLGIYAQQMGVKLQGLGLLLAALEFDPDSEAALLGLATTHERSGNYHRAAEYLLELLQAYPEHREGRLRMAVNLYRLGSADDAVRLLSNLTSEPENDWVATVAYQELARIHRETERIEVAEEVLWEGLERFPENGRLRTQLALILDLRRLPKRSLSVIEELDREAVRVGSPSARRLYGMGPGDAYAKARAALDESAASRVGRLARLLEGSSVEAPAVGGAR